MKFTQQHLSFLAAAAFMLCLTPSLNAAKPAPVVTPAAPTNQGCASGIAFVDLNRVVRESEAGKAIIENLNNRAKKIEKEISDLQAQAKPEEESDPMQQQEQQQKMMALYQSRQELYQAAQQFIPMLFNDILSQKIYNQEALRSSGYSAIVHKDVAIAVDSRCDITDVVIGSVNSLYSAHPQLFASPFDENAAPSMSTPGAG